MSQEFRGLPPAFAANQEDELLLVNPTSPTRISVKSFKYDSLATLKFKHPADQDYGIGQSNTWAVLPFNNLGFSGVQNWVTLNPDGSFLLDPGLYYLTAGVRLSSSNFQRLALFRGAGIAEVISEYSPSSGNSVATLNLLSRLSVIGQETFSLRIAVEQAKAFTLNVADSFLAGNQVTLATCTINKLG